MYPNSIPSHEFPDLHIIIVYTVHVYGVLKNIILYILLYLNVHKVYSHEADGKTVCGTEHSEDAEEVIQRDFRHATPPPGNGADETTAAAVRGCASDKGDVYTIVVFLWGGFELLWGWCDGRWRFYVNTGGVLFIRLIRSARSVGLFALGPIRKHVYVCVCCVCVCVGVCVYLPLLYIYTCTICRTVAGKRKCFPFKLARLIDFSPARRTTTPHRHSRSILGYLFRFFITLFRVSRLQELPRTNWLPRRKAIVKSQLYMLYLHDGIRTTGRL